MTGKAWFTCVVLRSCVLDTVVGGWSACLRLFLERQLLGRNGLSTVGCPVSLGGEHRLLYARLTNLLSDGDGLKQALDWKGASGLKACFKHCNVFKKVIGTRVGVRRFWLLSHTAASPLKLLRTPMRVSRAATWRIGCLVAWSQRRTKSLRSNCGHGWSVGTRWPCLSQLGLVCWQALCLRHDATSWRWSPASTPTLMDFWQVSTCTAL